MSTLLHHIYRTNDEIPYKYVKSLGSGGQGCVEAVSKDGFQYARKIVHQQRPLKPTDRDRILLEAKIVHDLSHEHIVRIIETYQQGHIFVIIMQPVAKGDLAKYLDDLDNTAGHEADQYKEQLMGWFRCLANAMAYLHDAKVRHRDIKPRNILTIQGNVKLTDFGISQEIEEATVTGEYDHPGTATYQSPERARREQAGRRDDIFSLGAVFLEMLTVYPGPGKLARFKSSRGGAFSQNLDRIEEWIQLLYREGGVPCWFLSMLWLCGLMLEEKRINRPYATDVLAFWEYSLAICGYVTSMLPSARAHCDCIVPSNHAELQIRSKWSEVLRDVSHKGEWNPEFMAVETWESTAARCYESQMDRWGVRNCQLSDEQKHMIFGISLSKTLLPLSSRVVAEAGVVFKRHITADNVKGNAKHIVDILFQPQAGQFADTVSSFIDKIMEVVDKDIHEISLYIELCIAMSVRFGEVASRTTPGNNLSGARTCDFVQCFHRGLVETFRDLFVPGDQNPSRVVACARLAMFLIHGLCILLDPRRINFESFTVKPCHKGLDTEARLLGFYLIGLARILDIAGKAVQDYHRTILDQCFEIIQATIAPIGPCWRWKAILDDVFTLREFEWAPRDRFCPQDECARLGPQPFQKYDDFLRHILQAHGSG